MCEVRYLLIPSSSLVATSILKGKQTEPIQQRLYPYSLHDTFEFINQINTQNARNSCMCSLDVSSLFTNVPLLETIDYIFIDFIDHSGLTFDVPTAALKELLLNCTFNIEFKFNGKLYRQIDGVAMGSLLGPMLADIFLGKLETQPVKNYIDKMRFYRR